VETLVEEALRLADQMGIDLPDDLRDMIPGGPGATVTVH
jgi:(E)-4-hydroxy-3-methylbut-2-enyl-diphosphate synthase